MKTEDEIREYIRELESGISGCDKNGFCINCIYDKKIISELKWVLGETQ